MRYAFILICLFCFVSAAFPQSSSPTPARPSDAEALAKALDQRSAVEIENALTAFIDQYPESARLTSARTSLASIRVNQAEEKFINGDPSAVKLFISAVEASPQPVPDKLFSDMLSRIPGRLYSAREWAGAYMVAEALELKIQDNAAQLTSLAGFYLTVEDGERALILARRATEIDENSAAAFSVLGLASRLTFDFNGSEDAFIKALELDPASAGAKRGLAEIKRTLGKYEEAAMLYAELMEEDAEDVSALTGKILSELEFSDRDKVEDELDAALEKYPQNVQLLSGAAYWYALRGNAEKALDFADLALVIEPRYVWAHIARARGLMIQNKPLEAEKALLTARNIANFPSLEYEIAMTRYDTGLYKEAVEDLAKVFSIKDGKLTARLGGRIEKEADDFIGLVDMENKASIFISQRSENDMRARKLKELLQLKTDIESENAESAAASARRFAEGSDSMKIHRHLYAAEALINRNIAGDAAISLIQAAVPYSEAGSKEKYSTMATMANELYDVRRAAFIQGEYIEQPSVPQPTVLSIIRGRIEEMTGMALQSVNKTSEAAVRYNRALSILPENSAWSRSAHWRLGLIEREKGNEKSALQHFVSSYDRTRPDMVKYTLIEAIFTKLNGSSEGLDRIIGPNPMPGKLAGEQNETVKEPDAVENQPLKETEPVKAVETENDADKNPETESGEVKVEVKDVSGQKPLFDPIIIGLKKPEQEKSVVDETGSGSLRQRSISEKPAAEPEDQCKISTSQEIIVLRKNGGSTALLAGVDGISTALQITSASPDDISVTIEKDPAITTSKTFFVIRSISDKTGEFEVKLKSECSEKTLKVTVR